MEWRRQPPALPPRPAGGPVDPARTRTEQERAVARGTAP